MSLQPDDLPTVVRHARLAALLTALSSLGVPDALAGGPLQAGELARRVGVPPDRLDRLLLAATGMGAFDLGEDGYALTDFSRQLRREGDGSMGSMLVGWSMLRVGQVALAHLDSAVRDGTSGVEAAYGRSFHAYLDAHPDEAQRYGRAMESTVESFAAGARAYDFSEFDTVVDVGGGGHDPRHWRRTPSPTGSTSSPATCSTTCLSARTPSGRTISTARTWLPGRAATAHARRAARQASSSRHRRTVE